VAGLEQHRDDRELSVGILCTRCATMSYGLPVDPFLARLVEVELHELCTVCRPTLMKLRARS
jgi:hypothetical protein